MKKARDYAFEIAGRFIPIEPNDYTEGEIAAIEKLLKQYATECVDRYEQRRLNLGV